MSFFYPSPAAVARTRRARESMRSNTGSTTRRAKDTSKSREEKSTPSSSPPTSHPNHPDFPLDSPHSAAVSSRTVTPSKHLAHHPTLDTSGTYPLPSQLETPAALQQYLDREGLGEMHIETSCAHSEASSLVQSLPDLKATPSTGAYHAYEDVQSVRSEPADSSHEMTTHGNESTPAKFESPTSYTSPASLTEQSDITRERLHTPPHSHGTNNQSYSPPPYMSPIPVRAHPYTQPFLSYHSTPVVPFAPSGQLYTDMHHQAQIPGQYYNDYTTRAQQSAPGHVQRTQTQEVTSASHRRLGRRPVSYTGDEDVFALLNRINSVLPDFHVLLDRYEDTCNQLSGEPKSRRQSETQLKDALREKDGYIGKLRREIEATHEENQTEKERLETENSKSQAIQRDLQNSLLARTKSRDHLQERSDQLQKCYDDLLTHSKRTELALDTFRSWVMQEAQVKERSLGVEEKQTSHHQVLSEAHAVSSPEPSVPGQFAESRGPSPLPLDPTAPHIPHDLSHSTVYETRIIGTAQLREALARETENLESQAWQQREMYLREMFQRDRDAQAQAWDEESGQLKRRWEQHQQFVIDQHEQEKAELNRLLEAAQVRHHTRCRELEDDNHDLRAQVDDLKAQLASERARRSRLTTEVQAAAMRVEHESRHLRHLMESEDSSRAARHITDGERGAGRSSAAAA